jgi:hypothetical protein
MLEERRAAGITGFHASLAGYGEIHDRWNGRAGDFDYQISILRLAGERGMVRQEKLFLTQNTLPIFDRLLDILDGIPGKLSRRTANPFFYAGLATRYEAERLTEDDRDGLPERINRLRPKGFDDWLSEREWIPIMMETADQPRKLLLKLDVDETNIDYLETASCDEIFAERQRQYQESYRLIPALDELCARYGDAANRKIYMMSRDVEGRWLDLHARATGTRPPIDWAHRRHLRRPGRFALGDGMRAWDSMETFADRPMSEISTPLPRPLRDNRFAIISAPVGRYSLTFTSSR